MTQATKQYDQEVYGHLICIELVISSISHSFDRDAMRSNISKMIEEMPLTELSEDEVEELKQGARTSLRRMLGPPKEAAAQESR
jgi:hypothetical protein